MGLRPFLGFGTRLFLLGVMVEPIPWGWPDKFSFVVFHLRLGGYGLR